MTKATKRAAAKSKARRASESADQEIRRFYRPGVYEQGLQVLAREVDAAANEREILALRAEFLQLRAAIESVEPRCRPLQEAFEAIFRVQGWNAAEVWSKESDYGALEKEVANLRERATYLVERMIKLGPRTRAGIAAVAASFKVDQRHFWKEPEPDRDWEISLLTRFIDSLIECESSAKPAEARS
jgi:hypothetical protein